MMNKTIPQKKAIFPMFKKQPGQQTLIRICLAFIILSLLFAIFLHAYMGIFTRYMADDYCTAGELKSFGFFGAIGNRYLNWDGRYSFTVFIYLFSLFGEKFPAILPAIAITTWLFSSFFFFKVIAEKFFSKPSNLIILLVTCLFMFIIVASVPRLADDFYWMTGVTTYLFSIMFEFLLLGYVIYTVPTLHKSPISKKIMHAVVLFLFSFINSGWSEVSTAIHVAIFGIILIIAAIRSIMAKKISRGFLYYCFLFLGAGVGFAIMALAPGNHVRWSTMSWWAVHPGMFELLVSSFLSSIKFAIKWLTQYQGVIWPSFTLFIIVFAFFPSFSSLKGPATRRYSLSRLILFIVCMFTLLFVSFIPTLWTGYSTPAQRILVLQTAIVSITAAVSSIYLGLLLRESFKIEDNKSRAPVFVLLIFAVLFSATVPISYAREYYLDYFHELKRFSQKWDEVHIEIQREIAMGKQEIIVENVSYEILVSNNERITGNPDYWTNICAASYYQVDEIYSK